MSGSVETFVKEFTDKHRIYANGDGIVENNLRACRKAAGLSQQEVADIFAHKYGKSTVVRQTVGRWEKGVRNGKESLPDLENAFILARIYKCKVDDLFSLED